MEGCQLAPGGPGGPLLTMSDAPRTCTICGQSQGGEGLPGYGLAPLFVEQGRDAIFWDWLFMRFSRHRFRQTTCFLGVFARNRPNY